MPSFFSHHRPLIATLMLAAVGVGIVFALQSASGEWERRGRIGTFQIRSEIPLGEIKGQDLLRQIAQLRHEVESTLGLRGPGRPIQVNLFQSRDSYEAFLLPRIPAVANRTAVFVENAEQGQIYVCFHPGFEEDVRHESTHAVLHESLSGIPLWLDEGLAEYFELPTQQRSDDNPYLLELRAQIQQEWAPDLPRLERLAVVDDVRLDDYRECWAWVHFLLHGPAPAREQFREYLKTLESGKPAGRLSDRLSGCLPDMDVQLINHLKNW